MYVKAITLLSLAACLTTVLAGKCESGIDHDDGHSCHGKTGNHACSRTGNHIVRTLIVPVEIGMLRFFADDCRKLTCGTVGLWFVEKTCDKEYDFCDGCKCIPIPVGPPPPPPPKE